ncbi:MAG: hypothetical protein WD426_12310 [Anditalea sp.]
MKEQFDKKLVEKIKDSFQNHEEPFNSQEWEKLSHSYFQPAKKKKFAYWPFLASGVAASLLLLLVFWPVGIDLKKNVKTFTESITIDNKQFEKIELPKGKQQLALKEEKGSSTFNGSFKGGDNMPELSTKNAETSTRENIVAIGKIDPGSQEISPSLSEMAVRLKLSRKIKEDLRENAANDKIGNLSIAQNDTNKAQEWVNQWKGDGQNTSATETILKRNNNNNVRLGLLVGPQASSNPVSGMTFGAGVMSEFSFSNRLKLDVGVTYAKHSMVPENGNSLPQNATMSSLSTKSDFIGSNAELNFSGLDIPINLKYKVMDKEQSVLFLITGLSSMVYLNQQTTETLAVNSYFTANTNGTLDFQRSVQEFTHEAGPEDNADGVDLGRMLNLSIGYEYNLKNGTFLSIEPYYKLPLGNMTFADQKFSIGGLNLRMNFRIGK